MDQDREVIDIQESDAEGDSTSHRVEKRREKKKSKTIVSTRRVASDPTSSLEEQRDSDKKAKKRALSTDLDDRKGKRKADKGQSVSYRAINLGED